MVVAVNPTDMPWVEKYRPSTLDELISHENILKTIQNFIKNKHLPHLLFYGPPGTGKTSTILAVAKSLYPASQISSMVLELNASDDRGIGIVRGQILSFASTKSIFMNNFKLIILDEADAMTKDAQNALRRIMEKYTENTRFCLICNYLSKIIPAVQSRCTRFRFAPLSIDQMKPRIDHIVNSEKVKLADSGLEALLKLSCGDMRRSISILECTHMGYGVVDEDSVYACTGQPKPADIQLIVNWLLNEDFGAAFRKVSDLKTLQGLALQDCITEIFHFLDRIELPDMVRIYLIEGLAELEHRISIGGSEKVQLCSLVGLFCIAKDMAVDIVSKEEEETTMETS